MRNHRLPVLIGCAMLLAVSLSTPEQVRSYAGAAQLRTLDQLTVVYPADQQGQPPINRGAADRIAAHFSLRHGVVTQIASDEAVSAAQLAGHLLVLGWQNRLFDDARAPRPFSRDESGIRFLDGITGTPDADLMFIHPSPFNHDRYIAFWSRIDPEREKLWGFPFNGSEWILYSDYHATQLGMFAESMQWPPRRNPIAEKHGTYNLPVFRTASPHYRLHYASGSVDAAQAQLILASREIAFEKTIERLGDPGEGFTIELYVYSDREEKERQTGISDPVHCLPRSGELHMIRSHARSTNSQNDTHMVARAQLGPNSLSALYQGLPLALNAEETPDELPFLAALLNEKQTLPGVAELLDDERLRLRALAGSGFSGSTLLVAWIRDQGGNEGFGQAYQMARVTAMTDLAHILDIPEGELEASFSAWVDGLARSGKAELGFRLAVEEARKHGKIGNIEAELESIAEALTFKPADRPTLYYQGLIQRKVGDHEAAIATFHRLLKLGEEVTAERYGIFSNYQLGQLYDLINQPRKAVRHYQQVLESPDQYDSHQMVRDALEKRVTGD